MLYTLVIRSVSLSGCLNMSFSDVLIIGGGYAGLSAAICLTRQSCSVTLFDFYDLAGASHFYDGTISYTNGTSENYHTAAFAELKRYDWFTFKSVEVRRLAEIRGGFQVTDNEGGKYDGKKVILANGVVSPFPDIPGFLDCWGKGM